MVKRALWAPVGKHPEHAEIKDEVTRRLDEGEEPIEIARDFNERRVPLIMAQWYPATIKEFAGDPRYIGVRTHLGNVTKEDAWPAIVDKETHARCVAVIKKRSGAKYNSRPGKALYWLPGIAVCDVCDAPLFSGKNASPSDRRRGKVTLRLNCMQPGQGEDKGYHVSRAMAPVDEYVENQLFDWLASPEFVEAYTSGDEELMRKIADAEGEAALLKARLEEFREKATDGELSLDSLAAAERKLTPRIAAAEELARSMRAPELVQDFVGASRDEIEQAWGKLHLSQRRMIAETLIKVRVKPTGRGTNYLRPIEEFVTVTPRHLVTSDVATGA